MNAEYSDNTEESFDALRIRLSDIFVWIAIAAIGLAIFVPIFKAKSIEARKAVVLLIAVQWSVAAAVAAIPYLRRKRALREIGRKIGNGYSGSLKTRRWWTWFSLGVFVLYCGLLVGLAFIQSNQSPKVRQTNQWLFWIPSASHGLNLGMILSSFLTGSFRARAEFYEAGVLFGSTRYSWSQVTVEESELYSDGIVVRFGNRKSPWFSGMLTLRISPEIRAQVFERSANASASDRQVTK